MAKAEITIIEDTGFLADLQNECNYNQTILFGIGTQRFKINIHYDSTYRFQSYARLEKWTENNGFSNIISKNPQRDYQIELALNIHPEAFKDIIKDLNRIATAFVS